MVLRQVAFAVLAAAAVARSDSPALAVDHLEAERQVVGQSRCSQEQAQEGHHSVGLWLHCVVV